MNSGNTRSNPVLGAAAIYGLLILVAVVLWTTIAAAARESRQVAAAYVRQAEFRQLGAELARGSDYLTDEVRKYAQFGDRRHYDNFWREVRETRTRDRVVASLRALGAPADELQLLEEAKQNSDELIATENRAMALVAQGKLDPARQLLFGPQYDAAKQRIMGPIGEFHRRIRARTDREVARARAAERQAFSTLGTTSALCVLVMLAGFTVYLRATARRRRRLQQTAVLLASSATEMLAVLEHQEQAMREQSTSVQQTAGTMVELDHSFRQTADMAQRAAQTAQEMRAAAEAGSEASEGMRRGIADLEQKVEVVSTHIQGLSERTQQIGTISHLVGELADQTNVLAVNAAVEAARAGDYGRGFQVLAGEIRKLADESHRSAARISELVAEIEKATSATVIVTEAGAKSARDGVRLADDTAQAFQTVARAVDGASVGAHQISLNIREQTAAIDPVVEAMSALNERARETAAGITQTRNGIRNLNEAAQELNALV